MFIDTVMNLIEIVVLNCTSGDETAHALEHIWLYQYPQLNRCIHNQGPKFNNHMFQFKLTKCSIKMHPILMVKNPQVNSVYEHLHQTIANLIFVFVHTDPQQTALEAQQLIEDTFHTTYVLLCRTLDFCSTELCAVLFITVGPF